MKPTLFCPIGTRPEAIKMAPLLSALRQSAVSDTYVLLTGQHPLSPEDILSSFGVFPDESFFLRRKDGSLGALWEALLSPLDDALARLSPAAVLVHGDTATAAASALCAFHRSIPIFHVEAGLRTGSLSSPFPEEFYRVMIDRLSALCFAPTERARENLLTEGKEPSRIFVTGNTAIDALFHTVRESFSHPALTAASGRAFILVTAHRRENRGEPYRAVCRAIRRAADISPSLFFLFVTHPNSLLAEEASSLLSGHERVLLSPPLPHDVLQNLLARADLLLTDSGGLQEEGCALGVKTLVLRQSTERAEGLAGGCLTLVGTEEEALFRAILSFSHPPLPHAPDPCFGDGNASAKILSIIEEHIIKPKHP